MTDQPTTEPSKAGLRIEHGWLVEETTGCTCAGGTEESSYLHEPGCGLTPLQRLDDLPGWPLAPAPQPAADTETEVQWGVRDLSGGLELLPSKVVAEDFRRIYGGTLISIREEA